MYLDRVFFAHGPIIPLDILNKGLNDRIYSDAAHLTYLNIYLVTNAKYDVCIMSFAEMLGYFYVHYIHNICPRWWERLVVLRSIGFVPTFCPFLYI